MNRVQNYPFYMGVRVSKMSNWIKTLYTWYKCVNALSVMSLSSLLLCVTILSRLNVRYLIANASNWLARLISWCKWVRHCNHDRNLISTGRIRRRWSKLARSDSRLFMRFLWRDFSSHSSRGSLNLIRVILCFIRLSESFQYSKESPQYAASKRKNKNSKSWTSYPDFQSTIRFVSAPILVLPL